MVVPEDSASEAAEYEIQRGVHVAVQENERVRAGDPLMDGRATRTTSSPSSARRNLQKYLVNEIQEVYRLQGVTINDKHIETITRQMMRCGED